ERHLSFVGAAEDDDTALEFGTERVCEAAKINAVFDEPRDDADAVHFDRLLFIARSTAAGDFLAELFQLAIELLLLFLQLNLQFLDGVIEFAEVLERAAAGQRFHAAHAGGE